MRIWIISDTHQYHSLLNIPEVEMVIHCGDFSNAQNPYKNELELRTALEWFSILPIQYKICTVGNHDCSFKGGLKTLVRPEEYPEINFLLHEAKNIAGINFFGSPYTPSYGNWAFMYQRHNANQFWEDIPENTDILITHGPPMGYLDLADHINDRKIPAQVGCKTLAKFTQNLKNINIHCYGHIHSTNRFNNYGIFESFGKKYINASCLNHTTNQLNPGHIINI